MDNQLDVHFYDTCSLLLAGEAIFESGEHFVISSITLKELEKIKTSANKDADIKYSARLLLHLLTEFRENYEVVVHALKYEDIIKEHSLEITDDTRILSDAINLNNYGKYVDRVIFVTNDLSLKNIANLFFGDKMIESVPEETDTYVGYKEVWDDNPILNDFYEHKDFNYFNLMIGQYLIIRRASNNEVADIYAWTGTEHRYLNYKNFNSIWFGSIKPYEKDVYQKLVFDSLTNNKITMIKGPAGSGKSLLSLGFLMSKLERGELDKVIIFCNTVATANSAKLGFLPGTKDEKLLDSQIGNFLTGKFGGRDAVNQLIETEKLILLPMSDIRGYDTSGMRAGIYITEAQNLDRTLMKLALQRVGEDCICIIDGDERTQVDMAIYKVDNGMRALSKTFRGHDFYGEIRLQNVYRSQIARLADEM